MHAKNLSHRTRWDIQVACQNNRVVKSRKKFGIGIGTGIITSGSSGLVVSGLASKFVSKKIVSCLFHSQNFFFLLNFLFKKFFYALFLKQKMALIAIYICMARNNIFMKK